MNIQIGPIFNGNFVDLIAVDPIGKCLQTNLGWRGTQAGILHDGAQEQECTHHY